MFRPIKATNEPPQSAGFGADPPESLAHQNLDAPAARTARAQQVLGRVLGLNLVLALLKGVVGALAGSAALIADAAHSLLDALNNGVGMAAVRVAARPPDDDHPYGHRKIEVVAALGMGAMIAAGAGAALHKVLVALTEGPARTSADAGLFQSTSAAWPLAVAALCLVASLAAGVWERRVGRELGSEVVTADAEDTLCDAWTTLVTLLGLGVQAAGWVWGDSLAAALIAALVLTTGLRMIWRSLDTLVDRSRLDPDAVRAVVHQVDDVVSCHAIRSRGPAGHIHLDLHVTLNPDRTLAEAGDRMLEIKARLHAAFEGLTDIVVQLEPHLPVHLPQTSPVPPTAPPQTPSWTAPRPYAAPPTGRPRLG